MAKALLTKPVQAVTRGGCYRFVNKTSHRANWNRQEGVVIWVGRRLLYGLGGGCYMQANLRVGRLRLQKWCLLILYTIVF